MESFRGNYDLPDRNVSLMPLMFIPESDGERIRNATKDSPLDTVCVCVCALWNICIRSLKSVSSAIFHWMSGKRIKCVALG